MKRLFTYVALIVAMLSIGGARAYFTAQTEVKDNMITAGTVLVSVEPTSAALTVEGLAPGETVSRTLEVRNTGSIACDAVTSAAKKAGITDFWNALQCRATCNGVELYAGPLSTLRTAPIRLGAGQAADLDLAVSLPSEAGNDLQGDYVRASVYVDAEQVR
ncbi:TasA family protein [Anaerosoma tenue]|uniref:TasA family protein n=1 Tax=Anaerosoma tenue TaxID=2933588 RepID=UPI0022608E33|nr:TasA family protein [Anaerosoma tenue]MCK8114501.1 CalY family protein [Anaerosoma tenue]